MNLLHKSLGFLAVLAAAPAANAVTARPSIMGVASTRLPTMTAYITTGTSSSTTSSSSTSSLLANVECIDAYTSCMKGADACGPDFAECTTKVLLHAKMPQCLSTLAQCSSAGINSLFGTGSTTALSNVASKNTYGEVTDYTYPTDGSVLGQLVIGAAISNKYDTGDCVKRYTSCLKRDSVCGSDFELCTTNTEFRKQMVFCSSTLARCQADGKIELFGSTNTSATPSASSRIGQMITEGASLAAINAVSTCYKVVDQCFLNACAANPYRCNENTSLELAKIVDAINAGTTADTSDVSVTDTVSKSVVSGYLKNACLDTIGANKYCYATFLGDGMMPTSSQLGDADNQEEIYAEAYNARMNTSLKSKIADMIDDFDAKAKDKCAQTIKTCAMRVCGSGSGAACYSQVFGDKNKSINNTTSHAEIKTGCAAIVNTDTYCKYAAANTTGTGTFNYAYINQDAFDTLFPIYEEDGDDPIGVVASLNATLATSYSAAALAQMKKQCQSVATSCVKSMCGADYVNCYRNRTDIYSSLTSTGDSSFDKSMNKVGGVLDYTIVLGLCLDTVKNAAVCEEHLAIETNKLKVNRNNTTSSWGSAGSVREGWIDAGGATAVTAETDTVAAVDENGNALCTTSGGMEQGTCYTVDDEGKVFDQPVMISYTSYVQSQAASTLFKDLVYDLEKEAQAKYNAKLTKEQNMCMAANSGGIIGNKDTGSTFMWVKLKSNRVPKNYSVAGLKPSQFGASNDLYGSFCRVRVTIQSEDPDIQDVIRKGTDWANGYFAVGDSFTCGSWIPSSALEQIANAVAQESIADKKKSYERTRDWLTALGSVGGVIGGAYLGQGIQNGSVFGSLTGIKNDKDNKSDIEKSAEACKSVITMMKPYITKDATQAHKDAVDQYMTILKSHTGKLDNKVQTNVLDEKISSWKSDTSKSAEAAAEADNVSKACENAKTLSGDKTDDGDNNKAWVGSLIGGVVTGVAGGFLLNKATKDIQDSKLDAATKAAYQEWMNNIGYKIHCYIGADEAGNYGDILTTSVE